MVDRQPIPTFQVDLNFDFIAADLLDGDQGRLHRGGRFHKHPALQFRWQQPFQALELTHLGLPRYQSG